MDTVRLALIREAENCEARGVALPLHLHTALIGMGIDASLYHKNGIQEELDFVDTNAELDRIGEPEEIITDSLT